MAQPLHPWRALIPSKNDIRSACGWSGRRVRETWRQILRESLGAGALGGPLLPLGAGLFLVRFAGRILARRHLPVVLRGRFACLGLDLATRLFLDLL